jgi:hypothetical protein
MSAVWQNAEQLLGVIHAPLAKAHRIAERRAFVELKTSFLQAAGDVAGPIGERLRLRVRQTNDTTELWRLRAAILCSLEPDHPRTAQHRRDLQRDLDSLFGPTTLA